MLAEEVGALTRAFSVLPEFRHSPCSEGLEKELLERDLRAQRGAP